MTLALAVRNALKLSHWQEPIFNYTHGAVEFILMLWKQDLSQIRACTQLELNLNWAPHVCFCCHWSVI